MFALSVRNLAKSYGATEALRGVNMSVEPGELVGLIGPNGAGKSTFVKIACGLVRPTEGEAEVWGAPAGSKPARAALGYLAEMFRFSPWLTAREVLELHRHLTNSEGPATEIDDLLELVGLGRVGDRRVAAMSKGMQQRLGIAQALVGSPKLLLLDEPTSALDPSGRRDVRVLLEEVRARGIAVLLNSHLLTEVELVCDRVVILKDGGVIAEGSPSDMGGPSGVEIETDAGLRRWPEATRADVPRLVAELVSEGALIYSVRPVKRSLEEIYMDTVGGEIS